MLIKESLQQNKINPAEIEIFLAHLLNKDRSFIRAFPDFKLNDNRSLKLKQFIKRREKGEPFAYILGFKEFCGLKFKVDKRVMVPRPETEELVNKVIQDIYADTNRSGENYWKHKQIKIIDVGTGSGNIAISLAYAIPFAKIYAVEKDKKAFDLAKRNISDHKLKKRIHLLPGHLLDPIRQLVERVDIVVANLPYIPTTKIPTLQPEIRNWEPLISLNGGRSGQELYRELFFQAKDIIKAGGTLYYEVDGNTFTKNY